MTQLMLDRDRLFSVGDAAQYLGGLSKYTIQAWLSSLKLPRTKIGSRTMIRESHLKAFIAQYNPGTHGTAKPAAAEANQ